MCLVIVHVIITSCCGLEHSLCFPILTNLCWPCDQIEVTVQQVMGPESTFNYCYLCMRLFVTGAQLSSALRFEREWKRTSGQSTSSVTPTGLPGSFKCGIICCPRDSAKYVNGTEVLAEDATGVVQRTFRDKSQKALSTIVMAISTPQLYLVTSCESPKDVWDMLHNHFECETLANKLFLKKKYFRKEMKEGMSMEAHLKEMKELTDKLASIGAAISEEDQVVTLLGSLPSSYSTIVTALEARVDDVSLNFVQQALVHEEQKQKDASKPDSSPDSALYGKGGYSPRKQPVGWDCQVVGHIRRFCPKNRWRVCAL